MQAPTLKPPASNPPRNPTAASVAAGPLASSASPAAPAAKPRGRIKQFIGWLVVIAVIVGGYFLFRQFASTSGNGAGSAASATSRPPPLVVATRARIGDMPVYITGLGTVQPLYSVTVHTRVNGPIVKVDFKEGQLVKEGDPLVEIDPRPFQVQFEQAKGQLDRDKALLEGAQNDLNLYQSASAGSVSAQQISDEQALVHQDAGLVEGDQAALDNANLQLSFCKITAPVTGLIGLRLIDVGNIVQTSDQNGVAVITTVQPITVVFPVAEDSIPLVIKRFDPANPLPVLAFDRDNGQQLAEGKLLAVDNQVNATNASVQVKALFDNKDNALYPGMFVKPRMLVDTLHNALIIPSAARQTGPDYTFVFRIEPQPAAPGARNLTGIAHLVKITTNSVEAETADQVVVDPPKTADELQPNDLVVTDGVDKLQEGTAVQYSVVDAGGNPPPGGAPGSRGARGSRGSRGNPQGAAPATQSSSPVNQ
jgi:multidrug efflux system membrane fusion protein